MENTKNHTSSKATLEYEKQEQIKSKTHVV
jgi:hypothetical protein